MRSVQACLAVAFLAGPTTVSAAEEWTQLKYDGRHSGDAPGRSVATPLGLVAAVPLTDAVFTAPVVAQGRVYVVDGAGVAFCLNADTLRVVWRFATPGGKANCSNVSSPAIAGRYLHFGTMAGGYYVLDASTGAVVRSIACGEPIFSAPVVANDRVYFATLGSKVYALEPDGRLCWTWDFVRQRLAFDGDRWSGQEWYRHKKGRVTWRDQFCCPCDMAAFGKTLIVPAGGQTVWLKDAGSQAELALVGSIPACAGNESPGIFGLTIDQTGGAYVQWHRRDNTGRVDFLRPAGGKFQTAAVPGTMAAVDRPESLAFTSVSLRGDDVFRCRPEAGFAFCVHRPGQPPQSLGGAPSIAAPILLRDVGVFGGLDGSLYVVPLSGSSKIWSFKTAFGRPISAPACVCNGRIYFGCEDGYLYALGPKGHAPLPAADLEVWKVRSPLTGKYADAKYDWFTNYGDQASTNANAQGLKPPLRIRWVRRYEGTFKHAPVCGGGRLYTHTAEGQIFAVEQETGRLLWRRYFPGVHASYTAPIYHQERLLVPQAGLEQSRLRCLDAATGALLWEAPFTGSPSWSRQLPPIIWKNLAVYVFGTGRHAPKGAGEVLGWLYSHDNPRYPADHKPLVQAWDIRSGRPVWTRDFSPFGSGGDDAGLCLMDGTLYYSCFFGYAATQKGLPGPTGITAALEPATGRVLWSTTKYSVTAGATISAGDGRLYLGGYNAADSKSGPRHVWCLDARNGGLVWESEPVDKAINVVTVGSKFLFAFAYGSKGYVIDKQSGKILSTFNEGYACTRFTLSEPYVLGPNMDLIDLAHGAAMISSGPPLDPRECVGTVVSNGRIFYTAQASGLQVCQLYGAEAAAAAPPWQGRD